MSKKHYPIVKPADADIDCPLFRQLQVFLVEALSAHREVAHREAVNFMRNFWINRDF
jgi:hypothetical protein